MPTVFSNFATIPSPAATWRSTEVSPSRPRIGAALGVAAAISLAACGEKNVVRSYYPSGTIKTEATVKDAVLNGRAVMMSETGGKLSEAEYKGGVLFGKSVSYFADGKVKAMAEYEDGALSGKSSSFHKGGQRASEAIFHKGVLVGPVRSWSEMGIEKIPEKPG